MLKKPVLKWAAILVTIFVISLLLFNIYQAGWFQPAEPIVNPPVMGDRLLIIAPHPDDETLPTAGVIQKAVNSGKTVKVVIITTGDGFRKAVIENYQVEKPQPEDYQRLGIDRHEESVAALQLLGVPRENIIFLGYPDSGEIRLWESNWDNNKPHRGLNGRTSSPYAFSYEQNVLYTGENLAKNLVQILQEYNPSDIIYPDGNDQHNDHWATNAFTQYALAKTKYGGQEWRYLVHLGEYPWPFQYSPALPLYPPQALKELGMKWLYFPLNKKEVNKKYLAVKQYCTQLKVMGSFLKGFVRKNELLIANERIRLGENSPIIVKSPVSNKIFEDKYTDAGLSGVIRGQTIESISINNTNHALEVGLKTKGKIKEGVLYRLNFRFFKDNDVNRLDLNIRDGRLSAKAITSESINIPDGSGLRYKDNEIRIELPASILEGVHSFLLYGETDESGKRLDKIPCILLQVPQD